jgi:hypothetical protein
MSDTLEFVAMLQKVLEHYPALLSYKQDAAARAANLERLNRDTASVIESHKVQARAEIKLERDAVLAEAEARARKIRADAEDYADKRRAEAKAAEKETVQARAELAQLEARIAEFHRVRQALAS